MPTRLRRWTVAIVWTVHIANRIKLGSINPDTQTFFQLFDCWRFPSNTKFPLLSCISTFLLLSLTCKAPKILSQMLHHVCGVSRGRIWSFNPLHLAKLKKPLAPTPVEVSAGMHHSHFSSSECWSRSGYSSNESNRDEMFWYAFRDHGWWWHVGIFY